MDAKKYINTAKSIINAVGKENILSITHCATRLRIVVENRDNIDDKKVEKIDLVKGVFYNAGQYQIILGTGTVNKVYKEIESLGVNATSKNEQDKIVKSKEKGIKLLMRTLADIFVPIVPIIASTGMFLGLKSCILNDSFLAIFGMTVTQIPEYINVIVALLTDTMFAFLPAIVCWSAFRVFGGTPVIGLIIGLMLLSPELPNAYEVANPNSGVEAIMAFGFIPIMGIQGSMLTAILTGILGAKLEKVLRKIMPASLDLIFTPFFVIITMILVVLFGFGPIMHSIELIMVDIIEKLIYLPFGIGGFIIAFTSPLAVLIGIHHMNVVIETSLLANTGFNPLITICAMYGFANVGSCIAFALKAKKKSVKATSLSALFSQIFGVSEPALFGLLIRYDIKPFLVMLVTTGIGGGLLSLFKIQSNSYGLAVLPSYLMYIYDTHQLMVYAVVSIVCVVMSFSLTYMFAIPKEVMIEDELESEVALENIE